MALHPDYAPATVVCSTTGTGLQPSTLDIGSIENIMALGGYPPVLTVIITNTATVVVYGSHDIDTAGALVDPLDISGGGFTTSDAYDLIPRFQFYQVDVTANTGRVTCKSDRNTQLLRFSNAATQGL